LSPVAAPFSIQRVNWHQIIDDRNFEMDQVIVSLLRREPAQLARVERWIDERLSDPGYSDQSKDALGEWQRIIRTRGTSGVIAVLEDRTETSARLRQSSPFAVLMPQEERMRILRRYEALRARTHPAGV
jgi:hypothetical protein